MTPEEAAEKSSSDDFEVEFRRMAKYLKQHLKQQLESECEKPYSWDDIQWVAGKAEIWVEEALQQEPLGWPERLVEVFVLHEFPDFYKAHGFEPEIGKRGKAAAKTFLSLIDPEPKELDKLKKEIEYD